MQSVEHSLRSIGPRQQQILGILNWVCTGPDLEELHDVFRAHEKQAILDLSAHCRRTSVSLSPSQRSSLSSTISSIFSSRDSWASVESYTSLSPTAHVAAEQPHSKRSEYHGYQALDLTRSFHETQYSSPANEASPYSRVERPRVHAQYFCITCQRCYTEQGGLNRHRREKCESKKGWVCLHCPPQSKPTFERPDRLKDHHNREHHAQGEVDVDGSVQQYPPKQAWGCPCCINCFNSVEKWREHEASHNHDVPWDGQSFDVKIDSWSFNTLIMSLLLGSQSLFPAAASYDWRRCSWSPETDLGRSVQYALERHVLPADIRRHPEYASRGVAESIVAYAYCTGSNGTPFLEHMPAPSSLYNSIPLVKSLTRTSCPSDLSITSCARTEQAAAQRSAHPNASSPAVLDVGQLRPISRPSRSQPSKTFANTTNNSNDQLCFQNLERVFGYRKSVHMEQIPLEPHAVALAPQTALPTEEDQMIQRGRSRQSSQSSITYEPKRARLSKSRTRSRCDLVSRPGSSKGKGLATDAPPLPSPRLREATLSALNAERVHDPGYCTSARARSNHARSRSAMPAGDDIGFDMQSIGTTSSKQLPVRNGQTSVDPADDRNKTNWFDSETSEFSLFEWS